MAQLANIASVPIPSTEKGQRSIPISEAYFARIIPSWSQPSILSPEQWRYWVRMQPIATTCKETMTSNISDLNQQIMQIEVSCNANDLRDQRERALKELAEKPVPCQATGSL